MVKLATHRYVADPLYKRYAVTPRRGSHCLYAHGFRVYFTPFTRVLFAFPSRYWFTIGRSGVFSLGGWSPHVQTGFLVPRPTHFSSHMRFRLPGYHRLWPAVPTVRLTHTQLLGCSPFARHYWG